MLNTCCWVHDKNAGTCQSDMTRNGSTLWLQSTQGNKHTVKKVANLMNDDDQTHCGIHEGA